MLALVSYFVTSLHAAEPARERLFNDAWRFVRGEVDGGDKADCKDDTWRKLSLPHDWSIESDFSEEFASCTGYLPGGIGWYRKHFTLPESSAGKRVYVRFEGVYRNSDVWLNGQHLGSRPSGYTDFEYDLTSHLLPAGGENVIAVKVAREQVADSRCYPGTGIYRDVWLTMVDPVHVARHGTFLTTPVVTDEEAMVNSVCEVANDSNKESEVTVTARVCDAEGHTVSSASSKQVLAAGASWNFPLFHPVEKPQRWSHEDPYLYQVIHRVEVAGRVVDEVTTSLGIRTIRFDANHGFFLNEKPVLIKGVCNHHDAGNLGAVMPRAVLERRLRILKDIGVNAIRCSHNPMQDDLYDLCDRMGLLVMDEAFDEWEMGKRKWVKGRNVGTATRFGYNEAFKAWAVPDVEAMVWGRPTRSAWRRCWTSRAITIRKPPMTRTTLHSREESSSAVKMATRWPPGMRSLTSHLSAASISGQVSISSARPIAGRRTAATRGCSIPQASSNRSDSSARRYGLLAPCSIWRFITRICAIPGFIGTKSRMKTRLSRWWPIAIYRRSPLN